MTDERPPDACEWCGWVAPTLRFLEVSWKKIVNISKGGVVVRSFDEPRVEAWWLCSLCVQRVPQRRPDVEGT